MCDNESSDGGSESQSPEEAEPEAEAEVQVEVEGEAEAEGEVEAEGEQTASQSDDSGICALKSEGASQEASKPSDSGDGEAAQISEPEETSDPLSEEAKAKPPPVPAPRVSFRSTDQRPLLRTPKAEKEELTVDQEDHDSGDNPSLNNPPGFLYKVCSPMAL